MNTINKINACDPSVRSCPEAVDNGQTGDDDTFVSGPNAMKLLGYIVPAGALLVSSLWGDGTPDANLIASRPTPSGTPILKKWPWLKWPNPERLSPQQLEEQAIKAFENKYRFPEGSVNKYYLALEYVTAFIKKGGLHDSLPDGLRRVMFRSLVEIQLNIERGRTVVPQAATDITFLKEQIAEKTERYGRFALDLMSAIGHRVNELKVSNTLSDTIDHLSRHDENFLERLTGSFLKRMMKGGKDPAATAPRLLARFTTDAMAFHRDGAHEKAQLLEILGEMFEFRGDYEPMQKAYEWLVRYELLSSQETKEHMGEFFKRAGDNLAPKFFMMESLAGSAGSQTDIKEILRTVASYEPKGSSLNKLANALVAGRNRKKTQELLEAVRNEAFRQYSPYDDDGRKARSERTAKELPARLENWRERAERVAERVRDARKTKIAGRK